MRTTKYEQNSFPHLHKRIFAQEPERLFTQTILSIAYLVFQNNLWKSIGNDGDFDTVKILVHKN